ncbi:unnamed protein product [Miscanthus lutarioriparius]|uniref:Uncharacterized protein n=1 Tax=Miscanthus lutarioriparius TaxID=422564 RepID=A0A811PV50_9POAL|nr:unnamed protein product [Miscanthus lutarioriparius]
MEVLFGSNNHGGDKAADLATLIIAQAALKVPRLLGLLAMGYGRREAAGVGSLGVIQQAVGGLGRIGPAYQTSPTYQ